MSHLALHVCCAPCMILPLEELLKEYDRVTVVYANSNIHPQSEYELRRNFAAQFAREMGAEFVELPYAPTTWFAAIEGLESRCEGCYELRLGAVAQWAADNDVQAMTSVLTISPYQNHEAIHACGRRACERVGITYLPKTFVAYYPQSVERSRSAGIYRQKYCGCVYSLEESLAQQRASEQRKNEVAAQKAQRRAEAEANKKNKQAKKEHDRAH